MKYMNVLMFYVKCEKIKYNINITTLIYIYRMSDKTSDKYKLIQRVTTN